MTAWIAPVASLIGGILGSSAEKRGIAAQNAYNDPAAYRARMEKAGYHPLAPLAGGVGVQTAVGGGNYMGTAIADAGLALADNLTRQQETARLEALTEQNQKLMDQVQNLTLRPAVYGPYGQNTGTPAMASALGVPDVQPDSSVGGSIPAGASADSASGVGFGRPLVTSDTVDPRRGVDNQDLISTSGFMKVDNPYLPFSLYSPTLDGDEALQWYQYPSLIAPAVIGAGIRAYEKGYMPFSDQYESWAGPRVQSYLDRPTVGLGGFSVKGGLSLKPSYYGSPSQRGF